MHATGARFAQAVGKGRGRTLLKLAAGAGAVGVGAYFYVGSVKSKAKTEMDQSMIPQYMKDVYDWAYVNPWTVRMLDNQLTVDSLLMLQAAPLEKMVIDMAKPGDKAIMVAHAYGDLIGQVADKVGPTGDFTLVDCTPIQVAQAAKKLANKPWARARRGDAGDPKTILPEGESLYDYVYTFLLLHEVPDQTKKDVVNNMLSSVKPDGKVVWVGYHGPCFWWHPMRYVMPVVYWWLEPFAFTMWEKEIWSHAKPELRNKFKWRKTVIGGNLYQCVVAEPLKPGEDRSGSCDTSDDIAPPHWLKRRLIASKCLL